MNPEDILIKDFTYSLPPDRIANHPSPQRDASKLLVYKNGRITDGAFLDLAAYLPDNAVLIFNNTRVLEARLLFQKETGGVIEVFCLEPYEQSMEVALQQNSSVQWKCLVGGASKWKPGQILRKKFKIDGKEGELQAFYKTKLDDGFVIGFAWDYQTASFAEVLHAAGAVPLPPYIKREADTVDADRYQTIFGKHQGSVAAPTAALHFTKEVFTRLQENGMEPAFITLNVGAGTFKPVKSESIAHHAMHGEDFTISKDVLEKIVSGKPVVAVGTTSLRTLESIYWLGVKLINGLIKSKDAWVLQQWEAYNLNSPVPTDESVGAIIKWMEENAVTELNCRTSLLIVPGYTFRIPQGLVTNFHQPQSTLLLLVAAFIGSNWKTVYEHALENDYRFLSYGDSSYLSLG